VIVTDAVFSMDGDAARLPEIVALAERYEAVTVVDEAHGTGVFGEHGRGAAEMAGVEHRIDLTLGTLSKALGGLGGFVVGARPWIDLVINRGRGFLFSTAAPAAQAAAARAALAIVRAEPDRRRRLHALAERVRSALADLSPPPPHTPAGSPIIPLVVGAAERATAASAALLERGFFVPAIRPPTVPVNGSRLRISVSATHTDGEIDGLIAAVRAELARPGASP
jgi:8-amino-7-oxononanoate synthase